MALRTLPDRALADQLITYNPATGVFTWHPRPREMFVTYRAFRVWNSRFAGKIAGHHPTRDGYSTICINHISYLCHRLAWLLSYGRPIPDMIDHADRNKRNNRLANLRAATVAQNHVNSTTRRDNLSTGIKGVSFSKAKKKYRARVQLNGKEVHIGYFPTLVEATAARIEAAERLFGDFARHS